MARVFVSSVVNTRTDRVWARVRDFNGLPNWHPAIAESRIEGGEPADKIGCVRDFRLRNGDRIREKLLGLPTTTCSAPCPILANRRWASRTMSRPCALLR